MSFRPNVVVTVYKLNSENKYEAIRHVPHEANPNDPDFIEQLKSASLDEDLVSLSGNNERTSEGFAIKYFFQR